MCGISVIINKDNSSVEKIEIKQINDLIKHRGPDGEGFYYGKNFAFGHRRLSIIDLSSHGDQPMNYNNEYVIVFNGEIYNYIEIKKELSKLGYKFNSTSDTEVILAAYDLWGINCVNHFNGMWAFVLYDRKNNHLFCSRDRFGIKPFYYALIGNKMIIGSELKQILHFVKKKEVNLPILMDYLVPNYEDHNNETFYKGIFKLDGSHNLIYNLNTHHFEIKKYYSIKVHDDISKLEEKEAIELFRNTFKRAIEIRLRSDVKVGSCLSGGLDSSALVTFASKLYNQKSNENFTAITAKSIEQATDESNYARLVVENSKINWHITEPSSESFLAEIKNVLTFQEEPTTNASIFMQYKVFEKAQNIGCKVMLDGQGGDETLLGYERYFPAYLSTQPMMQFLKSFILSSKHSRLSKKELFAYIFYFSNFYIRKKALRNRFSFIKKEYYKQLNDIYLKKSTKTYNNLMKLQYEEITSLQLPHLLRYEDKNSMAHSIESRLPFLDYNLLETSLSISNNLKIHNGWTKYILRKSIENYVPTEIAWRKNKLGFNAPEKIWINKYSKEIKREIKASYLLNTILNINEVMKNYNKLNLRVIWRLYNIALWEKREAPYL